MSIRPILSVAELRNNRFHVLATYRHLLRAINLTFAGDENTWPAARFQARATFNSNRWLEKGGVEAMTAVEHAQGVTQILKENVVQGQLKKEVKKGTTAGQGLYKLRMHRHTQKLDNETATKLKGSTKSFKKIKEERF